MRKLVAAVIFVACTKDPSPDGDAQADATPGELPGDATPADRASADATLDEAPTDTAAPDAGVPDGEARDAGDGAAEDLARDARADTVDIAPGDASLDAAAPDGARDAALDGSPDAGGDGAAADALPAPPFDPPPSRVPVLTFQHDVQRTGANRRERALTPAALRAGRLFRDRAFVTDLDGDLYGQPLYVPDLEVAGARHDVLVVGTQRNSLYALDARTGATLWRRALAPAVPLERMPCGNIGPTTGLVSTPVIDLASSTLYAVAYNSIDGGYTRRFTLHVLDLRTGAHRPGRDAVLLPPTTNGSTWEPGSLGQRGAITLVNGRVYIPFGGLFNDCSIYHGWVVGVDAERTLDQRAYATPGIGAGIWSVGGVASDGTGSLYVTTGNARVPGSFGSTLLRLEATATGPVFRGRSRDYYTPSNHAYMDVSDSDFGAISPIVLPTHPGSRTPRMLFQGSKHGQGYLVDRDDLGGVGVVRMGIDEAVFSDGLYAAGLYGAPAAWSDGAAVYVFAPGRGARARGCTGVGGVTALRLTLRDGVSQFQVAWCTGSVSNPSAPAVSSDGDRGAVLWLTGVSPPELRAYDVSTGAEVYVSRGVDALESVRQWTPPVVTDGRVYVTQHRAVALYRLR
ncbi:MAG: PQQ-binding-like beta-propeller repeat protein [Deltaproteobacteria bacterium]|nr:PQQ-binding-like beta-propeller repeat protein [Deltaproteobacteria bacterium]